MVTPGPPRRARSRPDLDVGTPSTRRARWPAHRPTSWRPRADGPRCAAGAAARVGLDAPACGRRPLARPTSSPGLGILDGRGLGRGRTAAAGGWRPEVQRRGRRAPAPRWPYPSCDHEASDPTPGARRRAPSPSGLRQPLDGFVDARARRAGSQRPHRAGLPRGRRRPPGRTARMTRRRRSRPRSPSRTCGAGWPCRAPTVGPAPRSPVAPRPRARSRPGACAAGSPTRTRGSGWPALRSRTTLPTVLDAAEAAALMDHAAVAADDGSPLAIARPGHRRAAVRDRHPRVRSCARCGRRRRRPAAPHACGCGARATRSARCPFGVPAAARARRLAAPPGSTLPRSASGPAALFVGVRGGRIDPRTVRTVVHRLLAECRRPAISPRTGCGTRPRRTCSRAAPTCARCRSCSGTPRWRRPSATRTCRSSGCGRTFALAHPRASPPDPAARRRGQPAASSSTAGRRRRRGAPGRDSRRRRAGRRAGSRGAAAVAAGGGHRPDDVPGGDRLPDAARSPITGS